MWWTPDWGADLARCRSMPFREALGTVVDMVRDGNESVWQFGATPFDNLQPNQKLAVVAQVGMRLLHENGTDAQTDRHFGGGSRGNLRRDPRHVGNGNRPDRLNGNCRPWRELVLAACLEQGIDELLDPPVQRSR